MKKILFICLSLIITIPLTVSAIDVHIHGEIGRTDSVTGPGNTVIQHSDGTTTRHHKDVPRRDIPRKESPRQARSIGNKKGQFFDFSCINWNGNRTNRTLRFDRDRLVLETQDAYVLKRIFFTRIYL
ncbi:hypothetical protein TI05_16970 [Achromatium sp. WMS3]|nr:hypothetical protein TI05_16970 [Achromatium sp. WMS3]